MKPLTTQTTRSAAQQRADIDMDQRLADALARAHHFTTTIKFETAYRTWRFATLAEARAAQPEMEQLANNHRKALVYCVTIDAMTHLVPDSYQLGEQQ